MPSEDLAPWLQLRESTHRSSRDCPQIMNRYRGLALGASTLLVGVVLGFVLLDLRDSWQAPRIVISDPLPGAEIGAVISGAVATPGTYMLPGDSRIVHLVDAAGGVTANADLANVNLAARLRDEQQVLVPTIEPVPAVA